MPCTSHSQLYLKPDTDDIWNDVFTPTSWRFPQLVVPDGIILFNAFEFEK